MELKTAKRIYAEGSDWVKTALEEEFGKDNLISIDFTEINNHDKARLSVGYDKDYLAVRHLETLDEWAYRMLKLVTKAINGKWIPDWNDINQPKWYNYFEVRSSGAVFSYSYALNYCQYTSVGSRLCFESSEKAEHARKYFENFYSQFLLITE